ncbi:transposase family protein [Acinetobacter equi]|uniref:transposase family protein n=1 Tax=Acinetobacter equi TaxID=1324350 RepID=UPI00130E7C26
MDVAEIPIQRPKKQKKIYSGKKKTHTFKVQAIVHYQTQKNLSYVPVEELYMILNSLKVTLIRFLRVPLYLQIKVIDGFTKCIRIAYYP